MHKFILLAALIFSTHGSLSCRKIEIAPASKPVAVANDINLDVLDITKNVQPENCSAHGIQLTKFEVPIRYGLLFRDADGSPSLVNSRNVIKRNVINLPHSAKSLEGGCVVKQQKRAIVYACRECTNLRLQRYGAQVWSDVIFELNTSEPAK
ncbi:MAG: hypothetical protein ACKVS6_06865 [Planctomycetota bacterium]